MKALHFIKIFIQLLIIILLVETTHAQSSITGKSLVGGVLEGNHVWSLAESPYVVDKDLEIRPEATLKIEAGVFVGFKYGKKVIVDGNLIIQGTAEKPVTFTATKSFLFPEPSTWEGIEISGDYAKVDIKFLDGQLAETFIHIINSSVNPIEISHSFLRDNQTGIEISRLSNSLRLHHNYISDNETGIIFKTPVPDKRIIYNQIRDNSVFNVVNLSGKTINLINNCWQKEDLVEADPSKNGNSQEITEEGIIKKPASNYCQPIPDLMRRSGGDITVVIDDDLRVSSHEPNYLVGFRVYPNPARDEIQLEYENITLDKLLIFNAIGQEIEAFDQIPYNRFTIPVSHLPAGIYYLQLNTNKGIFQHRVVVVENR